MTAEERFAVDTSFAVAYLDAGHSAHRLCTAFLADKSAVLAGHAAYESFAVLTRLPGSAAVSPDDAAAALRGAFGDPCWLGERAQADLFNRLATSGLQGGAVYDALVGEAARLHGRVLLTRDRRAMPTYAFLGVEVAVVPG